MIERMIVIKILFWLCVIAGLASVTCHLLGYCFLIIGAIFKVKP